MRPAGKDEREVTERLVGETDGFSFAYVKELFVSSMVRWMAGSRDGSIAPILFEQLVVLREQMRTDAALPPGAGAGRGRGRRLTDAPAVLRQRPRSPI